jgi:hypothetical protein
MIYYGVVAKVNAAGPHVVAFLAFLFSDDSTRLVRCYLHECERLRDTIG